PPLGAAWWRPIGSGKVGDCGEFNPLRAPTLPEHDVLERRRSEVEMPKSAECRPGACGPRPWRQSLTIVAGSCRRSHEPVRCPASPKCAVSGRATEQKR